MESFIYCTEAEIIDYLRKLGAGRDSRDTELSEAVRLKRLYENNFKKRFLIGIPVKPEGLRQMQAGKISKDEVIKKFRKEDTDVDILIINAADAGAIQRDGFDGDVFQMKRLTDRQFNGDFVSSVIEELKKIFAKGYTKSLYLSLYLAVNLKPQTHKPNWKSLVDFCVQNEVPFIRIILGPIKSEIGAELLVEIYPKLRFVSV